jgi:hypothetical protein
LSECDNANPRREGTLASAKTANIIHRPDIRRNILLQNNNTTPPLSRIYLGLSPLQLRLKESILITAGYSSASDQEPEKCVFARKIEKLSFAACHCKGSPRKEV